MAFDCCWYTSARYARYSCANVFARANRVRARGRGDRDAEKVITQAGAVVAGGKCRGRFAEMECVDDSAGDRIGLQQLCVRRHRQRAIARGGKREQDLRLGLRRRCRRDRQEETDHEARDGRADHPSPPSLHRAEDEVQVDESRRRTDSEPLIRLVGVRRLSRDGNCRSGRGAIGGPRVLVRRRPHDDVIADVLDQGRRAVAVRQPSGLDRDDRGRCRIAVRGRCRRARRRGRRP